MTGVRVDIVYDRRQKQHHQFENLESEQQVMTKETAIGETMNLENQIDVSTDSPSDTAQGMSEVVEPGDTSSCTEKLSDGEPSAGCDDQTSAGDNHEDTPSTSGLIDGLALWSSDGPGATPQSISVLRLDDNERLVIPFTTSLCRVSVHYTDAESYRGYLLCNGEDCLLCRIGKKSDTRDLWPVYDVIDRAVGVLPISPNIRPQGLRPQIHAAMTRLANDEPPFLMTIRSEGFGKFFVAIFDLPDDADDGAAVIAQFQRLLDSGRVDLTSAYDQLANEVLADTPELKAAMQAKGIKL